MKIKVYTSVTGGYDDPGGDILNVCHYDRFRCPRMNSRWAKMLSHKVVPDADWSIYVDGNITLRKSPEELVEMVGDHHVGVFAHYRRSTLQEEADEVKKTWPDMAQDVDLQMQGYAISGIDKAALCMCGVIVRWHSKLVEEMNEKWWSEFCSGAPRDQLSFPVAFDHAMVKIFPKVRNSRDNEYFTRRKHLKKDR